MPNGALTSLAGNVDPHHRIAVADLVLIQQRVWATIQHLMEEIQPELVGLSVMTFQRKTACKIIELLRSLRPAVRIVVGGYDPSMAPEAYAGSDVDFIVRGEGEITFRELLRAIETDRDYERISGLSYRVANRFRHNPDRSVSRLDRREIRLPNRQARVLSGYTMLGRQVDVVETSRGCTFDCSFCSIIAMRGRQFHTFSFDRVLADIRDAEDPPPLSQREVCMSTSTVRTVCGSSARTDLCGGRSAMTVPTAIDKENNSFARRIELNSPTTKSCEIWLKRRSVER
jgi:hypothetical protein